MNQIKFFNGNIVDKKINSSFCLKRLKKESCIHFLNEVLKDRNQGNIKMCPYGYTCVLGFNTVYCGFASKSNADYKKIRNHIKHSSNTAEKIESISEEELDALVKLSEDIDYCSACSETIHEIIHFCGQLRTLIDVCNEKNTHDEKIDLTIKGYADYIRIAEDYIKKRELIDSKYPRSVESSELSVKYIYYKELKNNYTEHIDNLHAACLRLDNAMKGYWEFEEEYKKKELFHVVTLFAMQSLFSFRLRYHKKFISELTDNSFSNSQSKPINLCVHKVIKKISNTLSYQARNKSTSIVFDGNSFNCFHFDNDEIILAIYILLENAVKYSLDCSNIIVSFADIDKNNTSLSISNTSNPIGDEIFPYIMEKGVSGENSRNINSNGLGLHIVKRILDVNNVKYYYNYNNGIFVFSLTFSKTN